MSNARDLVSLIRGKTTAKGAFRLATVDSAYTSGSGRPKVMFDGETSVSSKKYPYIASYTPAANDRILLASVSKGYVILGKVL